MANKNDGNLKLQRKGLGYIVLQRFIWDLVNFVGHFDLVIRIFSNGGRDLKMIFDEIDVNPMR